MSLSRALFAAALFLPFSSFATAQDRYADMDKDEAALWYVMDKAEVQIKTSGAIIRDPSLNEYVTNLTCEIVGDKCEELRIYLVDSPEFNASMAPNGMMLVNSGLMLRAENEAQLGCVIGHEFGHFEEGHSLLQWRAIKEANNVSLFIPLAGAFIGLAGLQSFSRDQEREADEIGLNIIADNQYQSGECAQVWSNLVAESSQSVVKRVRKGSQKSKNGMFSSHPVPKERIDNLTDLAAELPEGELLGYETYQQMTRPFLASWLQNELVSKDFDRHIFLFEALKERGRHAATIDYYIGEAYRQRREEGDKELAMEYWQKAAAGQDAPPAVWRALAEYDRRAGNKAEALAHYQTYLTKSPDAEDKLLIQKYIERLQTET